MIKMQILWIKIENHQDKYCLQYVLMNQKVDRIKVKEKRILDFFKYSLYIYHKNIYVYF